MLNQHGFVPNNWCQRGLMAFYETKPLTSLLQNILLWVFWPQQQGLCVASVSQSVTKLMETTAAH